MAIDVSPLGHYTYSNKLFYKVRHLIQAQEAATTSHKPDNSHDCRKGENR
ncbi:hypothetical protein Hanom_Chr12g01180561 [Helianthus anomalus]